ncbi:helix-turn-helix domain-containing protein [Shouchella miscanthi]|uniref:helix-turn-helix domain-containing protein n=1 Tax=Shouchella miscanthi TaxID=2598861 RepID=UPI001FE2864B|nr:helix-turn-helix domain-containing protein [Shouchella miscanthi]
MKKQIEDYPLLLNMKNVAEIMGFSERFTYDFVERDGFPLIRAGRTKRVFRDDMINWLNNQKVRKEA